MQPHAGRGDAASDPLAAPWLALPPAPAHPARVRARHAAFVVPMRKVDGAPPVAATPLAQRLGRVLLLLGTLLLASQLVQLAALGVLEPTLSTLGVGAFGAWLMLRALTAWRSDASSPPCAGCRSRR